MLMLHHNMTFKNEFITINGNHFEECDFVNCILHCIDSLDDPDGFIRMINCNFIGDCKLQGPGWPYEFLELFNIGEKFSWSGSLGNKNKTLH